MNELAIDFSGVVKDYGAVRAVDGLDLTIRRGETVALLGANGAGKSTTVSLLLGLLTPSSGSVRVFGRQPRDAVATGRVGAMLQDGGLMPGVRVAGLVDLARRVYDNPRPLADILADADLTGIANRRVEQLSGGQAQRVRFALAIAGDPDLLILDEPTTAMDVESRRAFWANLRERAAAGRTVLFTTHNLEEADENADRIVVVADGRIVTVGTPAEVKAAAGGYVVRFTTDEWATAGLDRLPCVTSVEIHGRSITLGTTDREATVRALFATREHVRDLEVTGTRLETAVLALTH